jgi:hypothetical protein
MFLSVLISVESFSLNSYFLYKELLLGNDQEPGDYTTTLSNCWFYKQGRCQAATENKEELAFSKRPAKKYLKINRGTVFSIRA